jgi:hypothetical protein
MISATGLLLDLRCVKERSYDRSRADANRDACFYQLVAAFFVRLVEIVVAVAHHPIFMAFDAALEVT